MTDNNSGNDATENSPVVADTNSTELSEQGQATANTVQLAPAPVVVQKPGRGLAIFSLLIALLALAGAGFSLYVNQVLEPQKESRLAVGVAEIGGQVSRLGDQIQRLQVAQDDVVSTAVLDAKLAEAANNTDVQVRDIQQSQQAVTSLVTKLNDDLTRGTSEYAIAEVGQLLKQANHSVNFSKDSAAAINALKLADSQLKELADPRYARVRQSINEEIATLEAVQAVDIESITGQLRALEKSIPSLPLENDTPTLGEIEVASVEGETGLRAGLRAMWRDVVNMLSVQIHRIDQTPKPLLAPEQRYFLNQNIQLQLAKAQLSVLQNRKAEYQASLAAAKGLLNDYFDPRDQEVIAAINKLDQLNEAELATELPSVAGSYELFQQAKGGQ